MNQHWIYFTIIVSGVIIFLAVVTPSILQVILSFSQKKSEENNNGKNVRSAVWAPIIFLGTFMILMGICVFSLKFSDCSILLDFMSLASAIVSIILAVLTIVYSYYTSGASLRNIENVQDSAKELNGTAQKLDNLSNEIDKDAKSLSNNIERILERLKIIDENTQSIKNYVQEEPRQLESEIVSSDKNVDIEKMINRCPLMALVFLYACGMAQGKNKIISIDLIFGRVEYNLMYFVGVHSILKTLGLLSTDITPEKAEFKIKHMNADLVRIVNQTVTDSTDDFVIEKRLKIDKYFQD